MKNIILTFSLVALVASCGPKSTTATVSKDTNTSNPTNPIQFANTITEDELRESLMIYASDDMEGRETGAPGQKKAVEYLKNQYVALGIPSPLANNNYFQDVPLEKAKSPNVDLTVNSKAFKNLNDFVSLASVQTSNITAKEIIYAGFGVDDDAYSDYANLEVKDKFVVVKSGEPKKEDGNFIISGTKETSKWSNMRQAFADKLNAAKDRGAKGIFFYDETVFPMLSQRYQAMAKQGSSGRISLADNKDNFSFFLMGKDLATALVPNIETADKPMTVASDITMVIENISEKLDSENVVAFIKGSEKPDEIIVISAHLDHEGIKNGQVYNGADDDGSGTVAILEIAEAFKSALDKGQGPKRSILFLHVTGEEKGLLGSRHYTDNDPIFPLENTVANLNIDMIGRIDPFLLPLRSLQLCKKQRTYYILL